MVRYCNKKERVIDIVLSYCHHTLQNTLLKDYISEFNKYHVSIINASPLAMGLLTKNGPPSWHPASKNIRKCCMKAVNYCIERGEDLSKIAIQYSIQTSKDLYMTTLLGMQTREEVENAVKWSSNNYSLDTNLLEQILKILKPCKNELWNSMT